MIIESSLLLKEISVFPELFLGMSLIYLTLHCSFLTVKQSYPLIYRSIVYLGFLVLILSLCLLLNDKLEVQGTGSFYNTIVTDYTGFLSKTIISILAGVCLLAVEPYLKTQKINNFEYVLLFLFSVLGLFLLCSANDLITTYLAIELQSLSFYVLASFKRQSTFSVNSGVKYFILGSFASCLFLLGSSLLYGISGTVNFDEFKDLYCFQQSCSEVVSSEFSDLDFFVDFLYCKQIIESSKFDLLHVFLNSPEVFNNLSGLPEIRQETFAIDIACFLNSVNSLFYDVLLNLILTFKGSDLGNSVFEMYSSNPCTTSKLMFLFSLHEVSSFYSENTFFPDNVSLVSLTNISLILILISFFFKLAVAPFHAWAPDVYEGSPSSSTFFFSVVPKLAIFIVMLRIYYFSFYSLIDSWRYLVCACVVLTILTGSFGGLTQKKIKSLLVYSSISHMGYSLIAFSSGTFESLQVLFNYLIIYSFSGLCVWAIFISTQLKSNFLQKSNKDLTDLVSLSKSNTMLAALFTAVLFSIAGFPPMVGFLVKINVFLSAIDSSMFFVALFSILCSVVATFYYIRIIKVLFFEKTVAGKLYHPISSFNALLITTIFSFILFLFLNPTLLFLLSHKFGLLFSTDIF